MPCDECAETRSQHAETRAQRDRLIIEDAVLRRQRFALADIETFALAMGYFGIARVARLARLGAIASEEINVRTTPNQIPR